MSFLSSNMKYMKLKHEQRGNNVWNSQAKTWRARFNQQSGNFIATSHNLIRLWCACCLQSSRRGMTSPDIAQKMFHRIYSLCYWMVTVCSTFVFVGRFPASWYVLALSQPVASGHERSRPNPLAVDCSLLPSSKKCWIPMHTHYPHLRKSYPPCFELDRNGQVH